MLPKFASIAFVIGTLLAASTPGLARGRGGNAGGSRPSGGSRSAGAAQSHANRGQSFSSGTRSYAPRGFSGGSRNFGGQSFVSPRSYDGRRGYPAGPRYNGRVYIAPRQPIYRGYYDGGLYLGYGAPYYGDYGYSYGPGYPYDPGYAYDPGYSYGTAPSPQQCSAGSYDRYGNWIPNPNCNSSQQYPPQQNYDPNQQQYPPGQPNYDPNQQQYPSGQPNYDPNQQQYPSRQQPGYDPNQSQPYNR